MILYKNRENKWIETDQLSEAINITLPKSYNSLRFISVVGAGGKSTVCRRLVREWSKLGLRSVLTTTTHILKEPGMPFFDNLDAAATFLNDKVGPIELGCERMISPSKIKVTSLPIETHIQLKEIADRVACEGDGASCRPAKFPNWHEPVFSPVTDLSIVVWGLSALGQPLAEVCHRPTLAAQYLGCQETDLLDAATSVKLIRGGYLQRNISVVESYDGELNPFFETLSPPENTPYVVVLNQADDPEHIALAKEMASALTPTPVLITQLLKF